jgi:FtsZ-binding cell division protein ZapB
MTETMTIETTRPEVFGTYINGEPTNVVRESDHVRMVAEKDDRIVGLVNLNETKVQTIQELRAEVERAQASEATEVQRSSEARAERDAAKRLHSQVREDICVWADEYDVDREEVNALLSTLGFDPIPEFIEAEVTITAVVKFKAGPGAGNDLSEFFVERNNDFELSVRPHYSSGLEVEEIEVATYDVTSVVAN